MLCIAVRPQLLFFFFSDSLCGGLLEVVVAHKMIAEPSSSLWGGEKEAVCMCACVRQLLGRMSFMCMLCWSEEGRKVQFEADGAVACVESEAAVLLCCCLSTSISASSAAVGVRKASYCRCTKRRTCWAG